MTIRSTLTVLFDDPFWIGLCERELDGGYEAARIVFGAEPKDYEIYDFVLRHWHELRFSPALPGTAAKPRANPKRMQRQVRRQTMARGVGTKAQKALKLQLEQGRLERKARTRQARDAEKARQFALHQEKKREKHRGH
ncbi:YjdF family protein [Gehongia tenuis]|uniref:YjdF family protein n=1 Tax=Gehongia tenuis TaxID=2763655 RepID=A0A926HPQ9_9FIRM|nr:YjdF family protein [Gehongia tenuis]MBC8530451.1 YjdF family protein [Gehongia tenuis]